MRLLFDPASCKYAAVSCDEKGEVGIKKALPHLHRICLLPAIPLGLKQLPEDSSFPAVLEAVNQTAADSVAKLYTAVAEKGKTYMICINLSWNTLDGLKVFYIIILISTDLLPSLFSSQEEPTCEQGALR